MTPKDLQQIEELLDRKGFATKDDLGLFATKEDLNTFATKGDLSLFATKDDLGLFATKEDLNSMKDDLTDLISETGKAILEAVEESMASKHELMDLEKRVSKLEEN